MNLLCGCTQGLGCDIRFREVWAKLIEEFCKELGSTNVVMGF